MSQNTPEIDPLAGGEKRPSVSFKNAAPGTTVTGVVVESAKVVQARDFNTGDPQFWDPIKKGQKTTVPNDRPCQNVVIAMNVGGEEQSLWAPMPSNLLSALKAAQAEAGTRIAPGGTLAVTFEREEPNKDNPRLNPKKIYTAKYEAPDALAGPDL